MSSAAGQSLLAPCDLAVTEDAVADIAVTEWPDVDVEELLRAHDVELLRIHEVKVEDAGKTKKEVEKRRHRESMARARSRHDQLMVSMRKQHQHLSQKLESGMVAWKRLREEAVRRDGDRRDASPGSDDDGGYTSGSSSSTIVEVVPLPNTELYAKYVTAVETENAIHKENEALAQRLEQLAIFETMLRVDTPEVNLIGALGKQYKGPSSRRGPLNRPGYWSYFAQDTEPFYYVPMTGPQCDLLIRNMYETCQSHYARFMAQMERLDPRDRVQFFGWTVQRAISDTTQIHFHFTKFFPCSDSSAVAGEMAEEGWRVFNSPEMYKKIYRTPMDVRVLQRVDAFNTVIMRNAPDASGSHRTRHLTLMSKIADVNTHGEKSLAILTLVVEPPEDAANFGKGGVRFMRDAYTYLRFDMCTDGVRFSYGGHADCLHPALAKYLFVETGNVLLRFEQMVRPSNLVVFS